MEIAKYVSERKDHEREAKWVWKQKAEKTKNYFNKKSTQNYYRLYTSKQNVKTARIFQPVPRIWVQSESMRVLIIPLFIEIARK